MNKNIIRHIWDKLTEVRLTHEAKLPTHPADHIRSLLNQDGLPGAVVEAARHLHALRQLEALGQAAIDYMSRPKDDAVPTGTETGETPSPTDDNVLDISADNQHLSDH